MVGGGPRWGRCSDAPFPALRTGASRRLTCIPYLTYHHTRPMRKKILKATQKLHALEAQRARLIHALTRPEPLLAGSLSLVNRTCGKPTCHCATKPGHPVWTLATTRDGRRRGQANSKPSKTKKRRSCAA